jgi:lactate 2-monooxygenase
MRANEAAFRRWRIVPRVLRDVSARDLSTTVLGTPIAAPLALAPVGVQSILHPDGELASARAAAAVGLPLTASTVSSVPLEQIAAATTGPKWFQLYFPTDRELADSFVRRVEQSGFGAILVTLDTVLPGWRPRDLQHGWLPFLHGLGIANYTSDPVFQARLPAGAAEDPGAAVGEFLRQFANPRLSWAEIEHLRSVTALPLALKGVLHPDDARRARELGVDAVVVSNHGGRQVDGVIAALQALPAILDTVGGELEVLLDSGVRTGADVFKALALGADAVLLGRPYVWGLAVGGEQGVVQVLRSVLAELDLTFGLCGYASPAELGPAALVREGSD